MPVSSVQRKGRMIWICSSALLVFFLLAGQPQSSLCDLEVTAGRLDNLLQNYERRFRPNYGGPPVTVNVTAYVLSMPEIDSNLQALTLNLYFRQTWMDPKLKSDNPQDETITLDGLHYDKIWFPDTFFTNEMSSTEHELTMPNVLLRIYPDGKVLKSVRYTIQLSCPMNFEYFPFDIQSCALEIESYGQTAADVVYQWGKANQSVGISQEALLGDFYLQAYQLKNSYITVSTGNYSRYVRQRLMVEFSFKRSSGGRFVLEFYLPCTFLTLLSLISLFLSDGRLAILINIITMGFTILFLSISSSLTELPKISYSTSLDVYSGITTMFIFISLIVSLLNFYLSRSGKRPERIELSRFGVASSTANRPERLEDDEVNLCSNQQQGNARPTPTSTFQSIVKTIEDISMLLLPLVKLAIVISYILANIIYWSVYPNANDNSAYIDDWIKMDYSA